MASIRQSVALLRRVWIPVTVAAIGLVLAVWYVGSPDLSVEYWRRELEATPEDEIVGVLQGVADLGDPGIAILVDALSSPREPVARCAREIVMATVADWETLSPTLAAPKLRRLVDELAARAANFEPESKKLAADLALRVLRWPTEGVAAEDREHLLATCVQVLQFDAPEEPIAKPSTSSQASAVPAGNLQQPRIAKHLPMSVKDLPFAPSPPELASKSRPASPAPQEPRRLDISTPVAPLPVVDAQTEPNTPASVVTGLDKGISVQDSGVVAAGGTITAEQLTSLPAIELFRLLHAGSTDGVAAIEAEMTRRGYTPRQMEIGKGLTNPDPSERRQWTESLPGLRGIDAKPWLMWLSRDPHADVRLAAITLMATSNDPEMLRRVAEVGRADNDPRVREQAARISADQR